MTCAFPSITNMDRRCRCRARPTANQMDHLPYLYVVVVSSLCIASPSTALNLNPGSNRYMKEIGKLLRDQQRLNVVASPPSETETEQNLRLEEQEEINMHWSQDQPLNGLDQPTPTYDCMFDNGHHSAPVSWDQNKFATPEPPSDPYRQPSRSTLDQFYGVRAQSQPEEFKQSNGAYNQQDTRSHFQQSEAEGQQYQQGSNARLFETLNGHVEALDHQFQASKSFSNDETPLPEVSWDNNAQSSYKVEHEYIEQQYGAPRDNGFDTNGSTQYDAVEANGSTYYFKAPEPAQSFDQIPNNVDQQGEYENLAQRQELERTEHENRAAVEAAKRAELDLQEREQIEQERLQQHYMQELRERERLEQERLQQDYIASVQAERERLRQEKEALERELAREKAENERRMYENQQQSQQPTAFKAENVRRMYEVQRQQQPAASITKSKLAPNLPETSDPFELLGLDDQNPPKDAEDIRRAFLKMAKKHHPDSIAKDATPAERERASANFARINTAYMKVKKRYEMLQDQHFATMLGGPMYEQRRRHGSGDFGSIFDADNYSSMNRGTQRHSSKTRGTHQWDKRNPFRRKRKEVQDSCHVSADDFPPFFGY